MSKSPSQKIVDLLNALMTMDPNAVKLFDSGVPCGDALIESELVNIRSGSDGNYLTFGGVINAIGGLLGDKIVTCWSVDGERSVLMGFAVRSSLIDADVTKGNRSPSYLDNTPESSLVETDVGV